MTRKVKRGPNTKPWIGDLNSAALRAGIEALHRRKSIPWRELRSIMAEAGPVLPSTASRFMNAAERAGAFKVTGRWDARAHRESRRVSIAPPPWPDSAMKWLTVPVFEAEPEAARPEAQPILQTGSPDDAESE